MNNINKSAVVSEYLQGGVSYRDLQGKYGCGLGTLHRWVHEYMQGKEYKAAEKEAIVFKQVRELLSEQEIVKDEAIPSDIETLQAELRKSRLHNKLLNEMLNIAEEELNVPIRKKHGARQS
jgi:transposase-like protein